MSVAKQLVRSMTPTSQYVEINMNSPAFEDILKEVAKKEKLPRLLLRDKVCLLLLEISKSRNYGCLN